MYTGNVVCVSEGILKFFFFFFMLSAAGFLLFERNLACFRKGTLEGGAIGGGGKGKGERGEGNGEGGERAVALTSLQMHCFYHYVRDFSSLLLLLLLLLLFVPPMRRERDQGAPAPPPTSLRRFVFEMG